MRHSNNFREDDNFYDDSFDQLPKSAIELVDYKCRGSVHTKIIEIEAYVADCDEIIKAVYSFDSHSFLEFPEDRKEYKEAIQAHLYQDEGADPKY